MDQNQRAAALGEVEVDETFLGGKQKNRHKNVRAKSSGRGGANTGKVTVIGAISRKGNVVAQMIENTSAETLSLFVEQTVNEKVSLVATDEYGGYADLNSISCPYLTVISMPTEPSLGPFLVPSRGSGSDKGQSP